MNGFTRLIDDGAIQFLSLSQRLTCALLLGDVTSDRDANTTPTDICASGTHFGIIERAIFAAMVGFKRGIDRQDIGEPRTDTRLTHIRIYIPCTETEHLFWHVTQHLSKMPIGFNNSEVLIENSDAIARILDQRSAPFGFVRQSHLSCLFGADIAPNGDPTIRPAQRYDPHVDLDIENAPVFAAEAIVKPSIARRTHLLDIRVQTGLIQISLYIQQRQLKHFLAAIAQHTTGCIANFEKTQRLGIYQIDAVSRLVDDGTVDFLPFPQCFLRHSDRGDIARDAQYPKELTTRIVDGRFDSFEQTAIAIIGKGEPFFVDTRPARRNRRLVVRPEKIG